MIHKLSERLEAQQFANDSLNLIDHTAQEIRGLSPAEVAALRVLLAPDALTLKRYRGALAAIAKGGVKHRDAAGIARRALGWHGRTKQEKHDDANNL